ncbi:hypothetical protein M8818_004473 [Zalaria obscura]|uniref:Uncharacterized protein n=1 Tax=Zalaria obscura TaxID=2024903 RepID=A0ACC3SC48_9PEZI
MPLLHDQAPPLKGIFDSLEGSWKLHRRLTSALPAFPSGTLTGSATFTPHAAFNGSSYLYHETGELKTDQGHVLKAKRKYIYRYSAEDDKISAWFVKEPHTEGQEDVDYLFHELEFEKSEGRWIAKGDHLCDMDMYWAMYDFRIGKEMGEDGMQVWGLRYKVKGPQKDYMSDTAYERQ